MRASARKITSREPRRSRRTGICRFAASSATARSKTKKSFHEARNNSCASTTSSPRASAARSTSKGQHWRSRVHLVPFFGPLGLSEITAGKVQEYRIHRLEEATAKRGKPPVRSTMHQEILRQTLKAAIRNGWLAVCRTFPSRTGHLQKSRTAPGSLLRNIKSSTKPPANARKSLRRHVTDGNRNSFTTMFFSRPTPAFGPTRRGVFNSRRRNR